jgi:hypothetical protein
MRRAATFVALLWVAAGSAAAQTMLDQQQRLMDIHALLLDLPPADAPAPLRPGRLSVGAEVIGVPPIDGTTGNKRQITASDQTPLFPRPRLALGLPVPPDFRAFVGLSYVPPVEVGNLTVNYVAGEGGFAWVRSPLQVGIRAHVFRAITRSPVTDPVIRDTFRVTGFGADVSAGYLLPLGRLAVTPYGGLGLTRVNGDFRVTSDDVLLTSTDTAVALHAGVRLVLSERWLGIAETDFYPGRLIHPNVRLAYLFDVFQ